MWPWSAGTFANWGRLLLNQVVISLFMLIANGSNPSCRPQIVKKRRLPTSCPRFSLPTWDIPRLQTGIKPVKEYGPRRTEFCWYRQHICACFPVRVPQIEEKYQDWNMETWIIFFVQITSGIYHCSFKNYYYFIIILIFFIIPIECQGQSTTTSVGKICLYWIKMLINTRCIY